MSLQLFDALDPATEAALRASIERWGVLVPVAQTADGRIIDGHHRTRIANELGISYPIDVIEAQSADDERELALTLNADRRHLTIEQRRPSVIALHEAGHSNVAIAKAHGVSEGTIRNDLSAATSQGYEVATPDRTIGLDGKSRPAKRPAAIAPEVTEDDVTAEDTPEPQTQIERATAVVNELRDEIEADSYAAFQFMEITGPLRRTTAAARALTDEQIDRGLTSSSILKRSDCESYLNQIERGAAELAAWVAERRVFLAQPLRRIK